MISMQKAYRTRDGREVRIYATDGDKDQAVHGAVKCPDGWTSYAWFSDGQYARADRNGRHDLIEVRPRHKRMVWLNVYDSGVSRGFELREWADVHADNDRIACIKVELDFEEGEGL